MPGIRTLCFPGIAPPDLPGSASIPTKEWGQDNDKQSCESGREGIERIIEPRRCLAQEFVPTVIANHRVKGIEQTIRGCTRQAKEHVIEEGGTNRVTHVLR